jgi:hypothetical protein
VPQAAVAATAASSAPATPVVAPSPASSPTGAAALALGKTASVSGGEADVTVYHYKQPVAASAPKPEQSGYIWGAIDVKVCVHRDASVSNTPWSLAYGDDTQLVPSSTGYDSFPTPAYPWGDKSMKSGHCIRGWITFPVPKSPKPTMVEYSLDDGTVVDWKA